MTVPDVTASRFDATMAGRLRDEVVRPSAPAAPHDFTIAARLRARITDAFDDTLAGIELGSKLYVSKSRLASVTSCEGLYLADTGFTWSVSAAVGTITHSAVKLLVARHPRRRHEPWPNLDLAEAAIDDAVADTGTTRGLREYLEGLDETTRASLVAEVAARIDAVYDTWATLPRAWNPRPGHTTGVNFPTRAGLVRVTGKADLILGPRAGGRSEVLVEWKTGDLRPEHRDEVWLYALLHTITTNRAPARVAVVSLCGDDLVVDDVDDAGLERAADRLVAGVSRIAELAVDPDPVLTPGRWCGWCPERDVCAAAELRRR